MNDHSEWTVCISPSNPNKSASSLSDANARARACVCVCVRNSLSHIGFISVSALFVVVVATQTATSRFPVFLLFCPAGSASRIAYKLHTECLQLPALYLKLTNAGSRVVRRSGAYAGVEFFSLRPICVRYNVDSYTQCCCWWSRAQT